jgi:hypothetical protein
MPVQSIESSLGVLGALAVQFATIPDGSLILLNFDLPSLHLKPN